MTTRSYDVRLADRASRHVLDGMPEPPGTHPVSG
jgi:hypothetical protein